MATRTYHCALTATITVDDETVKSAMLGFGLSEGIGGPPVDDEELVFTAQQQMLASLPHMPPERMLQIVLVNGYLDAADRLIQAVFTETLAGADVELTGIDVVEQPSNG